MGTDSIPDHQLRCHTLRLVLQFKITTTIILLLLLLLLL